MKRLMQNTCEVVEVSLFTILESFQNLFPKNFAIDSFVLET